jgi:YHS domain-containing protein
MHSGPALERAGDWFGATVNLASRVSGAARPGEVLVTAETRRECGSQDGIEFLPRGGRHFKHIPEPVPVYAAVNATAGTKELEIDPVCRMAVDPADAAATRRWRGASYYFCSAECERSFEQDPRRHIANSPAARAARTGFLINLTTFLIVGAAHIVSWAFGWADMGHHGNPPLFVYVGAAWALGLFIHYRAVRKVL